MKKILFMVINMNIGGTEKALLNLISELPKDQFEITILMLEEYGGFLESIPKNINMEYVDGYREIKKLVNNPLRISIKNALKNRRIIESLSLFFIFIMTKLLGDHSIFFKYILKNIPNIKKEYDIAVAYAGPMDFISYFVIRKIEANKKIQWVHFDVTKIGFSKKFSKRLYKKFNKIFVVSLEAKQKLLSFIPEISEKVDVFLNIISPKTIRNQAISGCGFNDQYSGIRILTVGRLSMEKGQDIAIEVLKKLIEEGYSVKWYCLGEGPSRAEYEKLIKQKKLQDHFILLGSDDNPYPYIKNCDIYVQPSRYEGYCLTIMEAKSLYKPIVTTDVNGVREQIKNGETGLIVKIDKNDVYSGITKLIDDKELYSTFIANLKKEEYNPQNEIHKIIQL